jgi:hypothetical protein
MRVAPPPQMHVPLGRSPALVPAITLGCEEWYCDCLKYWGFRGAIAEIKG